ncbi:MAG: hypothetical protein AAF730_15600 [Bacteroidota bacterium]
MPSLTLKGIPDELMVRLRERAHAERRSLNQQALRLLETALSDTRPNLLDAHAAYVEQHGPPPFDDAFFEGLRSPDMG